jgi:RNAse (barnase) inhibitor barstar
MSMAIRTLIRDVPWDTYGAQHLHTPVITSEKDCHNLDLLVDVMGTLTRMMDTRIAYVTSEGKVIREWIETILEICDRYERELKVLKRIEDELAAKVDSGQK